MHLNLRYCQPTMGILGYDPNLSRERSVYCYNFLHIIPSVGNTFPLLGHLVNLYSILNVLALMSSLCRALFTFVWKTQVLLPCSPASAGLPVCLPSFLYSFNLTESLLCARHSPHWGHSGNRADLVSDLLELKV